jgi:processive 1,2-diacylglycerol beta-glucosyltransferase
MVNHAPELWGYFYEQSERKYFTKHSIVKTFDKLNYNKYIRMLKNFKPDAVICTHYLPYVAISDLLQKKEITARFYAVTTDFDVHRLWVDPIIEKYFVYHEESAWQLASKNVLEEKIIISGIPVMPEFKYKENQKSVRNRLKINPDNFTILVLSGGYGMGKVTEIIRQINDTLSFLVKRKFNIIIVCGKNEKLKSEITSIRFPANVSKTIYGFVNNIHELMDVSDLLISKSGGLTSSEAMAKSLPVLIVEPIPGQESRNADIIVEHGAGWKAINIRNLGYKLKRILTEPSLLKGARESTKILSKPNAAEEIIKQIYWDLFSKLY